MVNGRRWFLALTLLRKAAPRNETPPHEPQHHHVNRLFLRAPHEHTFRKQRAMSDADLEEVCNACGYRRH